MRSLRHVRVGVLASLAALCALAFTAGPASAWNNESDGVRVSGTLTLKKSGTEPVTCTFPKFQFGATNGPELFEANYSLWKMSCSKGTLEWAPGGGVAKGIEFPYGITAGGYSNGAWSPYGTWHPLYYGQYVEWVNASGGTPSHYTLNELELGVTKSGLQPITVSGTIYVTTLKGGDLTFP